MGGYENLFQILKEEYGITTEEQLNEAVRRLGSLDITRFCVKPSMESCDTDRTDLNRHLTEQK